jgi:hypothetical protein
MSEAIKSVYKATDGQQEVASKVDHMVQILIDATKSHIERR